MPLPAFTDRGILPEGIHHCSLNEAQALLCANDTREIIWNGLLDFLQWANQFPQPDAFLLDGSFVTDKPLPDDIDVVVDVTGCAEADRQAWYIAFFTSHQLAKDNFRVDFYPFVIGVGKDFSAFFQYVRVEDALLRGLEPKLRTNARGLRHWTHSLTS
jgi:hypothetical protein